MARKAPKRSASSSRRRARRKPGRAASKKPAAKPLGPQADVESIQRLVELMLTNDLTEVNITNGKTKILLRRGAAAGAKEPPVLATAPVAPVAAPPAAQAAEPPAEEEAEKEGEEFIQITSPMVGTFYTASSPDSDLFVTVGSEVRDDTVVCIVEAMKVMNEIKAECRGTIAEICVKNAQPVEFGQVLFKVRPA